jgi:hypothetical protein
MIGVHTFIPVAGGLITVDQPTSINRRRSTDVGRPTVMGAATSASMKCQRGTVAGIGQIPSLLSSVPPIGMRIRLVAADGLA